MLAKIDVNQMENFKNLLPAFTTIAGDEDRTYSAPYMWGTTGFTYDPAMVPGGKLEDSWKAIFEPADELKGNIAMLNEMSDVWNAAAFYTGVSKCTEDPAEAQKILDVLMAQKPHVKLYSNDGTIDRMIAGEVAVHMQWNGAAHRVKEKKPDAVYVYPKEGTTFWTDVIAVPKDCAEPRGGEEIRQLDDVAGSGGDRIELHRLLQRGVGFGRVPQGGSEGQIRPSTRPRNTMTGCGRSRTARRRPRTCARRSGPSSSRNVKAQ